jgi:hypothetical protein
MDNSRTYPGFKGDRLCSKRCASFLLSLLGIVAARLQKPRAIPKLFTTNIYAEIDLETKAKSLANGEVTNAS